MSAPCFICLEPAPDHGEHHRRCVERLFGIRDVPALDLELAKLHTFALAMVGHTTLSGVQRKISLGLTTDRSRLQVAVERARFILKPATQQYPALPENELTTMTLAWRAAIDVPPFGLIRLKDGSLAYVVARFDRPAAGGKLRQEDFCQLAEKRPIQKYEGSAELCAKLVRRYASEPGIEMVKLFRRMAFVWWTGNGDMHLKNFSLHTGEDGRHRLSPAYDLVCTRLVIEGDRLALPVGGKKDRLARRHWLDYAASCGLATRAAARVLDELAAGLEPALEVVDRSPLPAGMRREYRKLLAERAASLVA